MKPYCLMWEKGFLLCHIVLSNDRVQMAVNAIGGLPTNWHSLLSWEPSWGRLSAPSVTFSWGLIPWDL